MDPNRRSLVRLAALGVGTALAGCLDAGDGDSGTPTDGPPGTEPGTPTDEPAPGRAITDHETLPFALRSAVPGWHDDGDVGHVVLVDSEERQQAVLAGYDLSGERRDDVESFLEGIDYATERLLVVESLGPDGCHDRLEVGDVRLEGGRIRATAAVLDTGEADEACTEAIVYPSTLLRVTFEGEPVDEAAVDVTDGRGETATLTASADDSLSPDPADLSGRVRPDADPEPIEPLACDDGVRRHPQPFEEANLQWGDFTDGGETVLSLRVEALEYSSGETARIELTNVTDGIVHTGNRHKYTLQVYTDAGWQDVRVKDEARHFEYTDEAVGHAPGSGFEWAVELTEEGLVAGTFHDDAEVCPGLPGGRYRFAYFGAIGDAAVAVSFDLS